MADVVAALHYREDVGCHLRHLAEAVAAGRPVLFTAYLDWAHSYRAHRNIPSEYLRDEIECLREALQEHLAAAPRSTVNRCIEAGLQTAGEPESPFPSFLEDESPLRNLARRHMALLLDGNLPAAMDGVLAEVDAGTPVEDVYLRVFQPALYEVGRCWQLNQVSVAEEHYFAEATRLIMSQLYPRVAASEKTRGSLVAMAVSDEMHELGARMVADIFQLAGWKTGLFGPNLPTHVVAHAVTTRQADVLAISATMTYHLAAVEEVIAAVRADGATSHVKILVGGLPFRLVPDLWQHVGADGFAPDARQAVAVAERLLAS
ncbi:MAG: cobalamin B12-binding domain-containing protein [Armatimonadota bacterium]